MQNKSLCNELVEEHSFCCGAAFYSQEKSTTTERRHFMVKAGTEAWEQFGGKNHKKSFSHLSTTHTHTHQELLPQRKSGNKMENIMWHHYAVVAINFLWATFIWLPEQRAAAILLRPMGVLVFYREQTPGHKTVVWGARGAGKIPALPARMAKAGTRPDGAPAGRGEGYSLRIMLNWLRRNEMKI